jgi:hypothetical protein
VLEARCAGAIRRLVVLMARCADVVRPPVVLIARRAGRDRVLGVIPYNARYARRDSVRCVIPTSARRAGVIACRVWFQPNARHAAWYRAEVVRGGWRHTNDGGQPAEHGVPADRFARKIVRFLTQFSAVRSRPAERQHRSAAGERGRHAFCRVHPARFLNARGAMRVVRVPVVLACYDRSLC